MGEASVAPHVGTQMPKFVVRNHKEWNCINPNGRFNILIRPWRMNSGSQMLQRSDVPGWAIPCEIREVYKTGQVVW